MIDNLVQGNILYYRVGFDFDTDGNVTGGWTFIHFPGDLGLEQQCADIDSASIAESK